MTDDDSGLFGLFWLFISILWILIPFMLWAALSRLKRIHEDLYRQNAEIQRLLSVIAGEAKSPEPVTTYGLAVSQEIPPPPPAS